MRPEGSTWHVSDHELDIIQQYVSQIVSPFNKPDVFTMTYNSIVNGLQAHRKKQMFMMEPDPITVEDYIRFFWEKDDPDPIIA